MKKEYPKNLEKKWGDFWQKEKIYEFNPKSKKQVFSIDTPPPTVSGKMHIGHVFSYTHHDLIVRYHRMKGKNIFFPFGTDDNGLPTEKLVEKENKVKIFKMKRNEFVELCQKTLKKMRPSFIQDWKNIGMSCDFKLDYSTINRFVQKLSQNFFIELYQKKRVYRKESSTLWCPQCQTAIAQADLEDKEVESVFNDIIFKLENGGEIIIATTRPELLSSCVAVFVHPADKRYKKFIGKTAIVPIFGQKVKISTDKKVDPEKGTGIVMCCTFGDTADVEWQLSHNLPVKISINKDGTMNKRAHSYQGLKVKETRQRIIEDLKKQRFVCKQKKIKHIVNVHERCDTEIEILNTIQWFIKYLDLKNDFLKFGKKIKWYPGYMRKRYDNWVKGLRWDWCISRQRYFGIPFPVWYCAKCGKVRIAKISELPVDPLHYQPKDKCSCGSGKFIPEKDVLDTWATSSLTPQIAIELVKNKEIRKKLFPMSLRPQAHDIINFWLFYTIARSKLHFNKIPFREIMISGFVLDSKGEKMSKSKGNVVAPQEIIKKYGADTLRHWTAKASLGGDLRWNEEEIKGSKRTITKLWNASRFSISHLKDFNFSKKKKNVNLYLVDRWILSKLQRTIKITTSHFENYQFAKAKKEIEDFFWKDFCDNYLELIKYRLYSLNKKDPLRKSAQFTLYNSLFSILKLFAPFIPYLTEEIYQLYFRKKEKEKSIHKSKWPETKNSLIDKKAESKVKILIKIASAIRKSKSEKNLSLIKPIKKLTIDCKKDLVKDISQFKKDLKEIGKVQKLEFQKIVRAKNGILIEKDLKIKIEF